MKPLDRKLVRLFGALAAVMFMAGTANAQDAIVEGKGVKVGEGTVLRPVVGVETGYVSNLFYQSADVQQVAALRLNLELSAASAGKARTESETFDGEEGDISQGAPAALAWSFGAKLRYTEYPFATTPNDLQRNLGADANVKVIVKPEGKFRFEFINHFARDTNPTNFVSAGQINREVNQLRTGLVYQPGGRAITAGLHYHNRIDYFEDNDQSFANRIQHNLVLSAGWQWLPITKFSFEGSFGFFGPLGTSAWKQTSNPIRGRIGVASAITEKTFGRASAGWAYSGYTFGEGYNTPTGDVEFGYRYSPTGKLSIAYSYDFRDSVNANYYRDHAVLLKIEQHFDRMVADGTIDVRLRGYRGIPMALASTSSREDLVLGSLARLRYLYRDWLSFDAQWRSRVDQTDFRYTVGPITGADPSFIRHEVYVGTSAAF